MFDLAVKNQKLKIQYVARDSQNIKKLLAGRIQVVPMEIDVGYGLINTELSPDKAPLVTTHPKPVTPHLRCYFKKDRANKGSKITFSL